MKRICYTEEDFQRQANYLLKKTLLLGLPQQVAYRSTRKSVTRVKDIN